MVFDQNAMIAQLLRVITRRVPVCSFCTGDTTYIEIVAEAMQGVPPTLWPDLDTTFQDNFSTQRKYYQKRLAEILGRYEPPKKKVDKPK